jgi:phosphoribosylformylglycinamidine synthase
MSPDTMTLEKPVDEALAKEHKLSADEYKHILKILGRAPTLTELGIFGAMWSEHCSYKSSRIHLRKLPTTGACVIQGPGENAGVIDIGDGDAAVFKMESHNHPSFIEPYQGAATGVGGIMRDVFTMGARPIANLNALRFGDPSHPKTRHLVEGVVAGIGGYGNCMGVPTVGGETNFHRGYNGNILVNAMTVGIARADKIFYSAAAGIGNPVVYVGSKTGRDGIRGAVMASGSFEAAGASQRPTVQVGDPFTEKLLLEACLELMGEDAIIAIQDMGAAGLTSSSVEMAAKGGVGIEIDLDLVPQREPGMSAYELMLSESQERMLIVLKPGTENLAEKIFHKWELDFAVIGRITDTGRMVIKRHGKVEADLVVDPLVDEAPKYDRPSIPTPKPAALDKAQYALPNDVGATLLKLLGCPDLASKRWIVEQYDSLVRGDTRFGPGAADAAIVRVGDGLTAGKKALAMTSDVTPRYCRADPFEGGKQAVAEAWRNLVATGAKPLAVTDNLNFGNPEKPQVMGQLIGCVEGMTEACRALDFPVVSGNVSLYNETDGDSIPPTPTIGGVGVIADVGKAVGLALTEGQDLILIGAPQGALGQSLYLREIHGAELGPPPAVDLAAERKTGEFIINLIDLGLLTACHDISDGGALCALTEMALAGNIGATVHLDKDAGALFGEDQACYLVATKNADKVLAAAKAASLPARALGKSGGAMLKVGDFISVTLDTLRAAHEDWLPNYMNG